MGAGVTSSLLMVPHDSVADGIAVWVGGEAWGDASGRGHGINQHFPSFALPGAGA